MADSPNLILPFIEAAQAQKHVTHNEALRALDAVVQLAVLDRDLTVPPGSPNDGDRYWVASGATGAWAGSADQIAAYQDGAWEFYAPNEGWTVWIADEDITLVWDGSALVSGVPDSLQNLSELGVNATADATNRLSISSPATLFNHEGNGHQIKVNKNGAGDTASFLFQTGFSGRAEIGLTGDDDFHFKVSPDGSTFYDSLVIDKDSGAVGLPSFTVSSTPSASGAGAGAIIYVSDEAGGAVLAFSDGTDWRRSTDRAVIS